MHQKRSRKSVKVNNRSSNSTLFDINRLTTTNKMCRNSSASSSTRTTFAATRTAATATAATTTRTRASLMLLVGSFLLTLGALHLQNYRALSLSLISEKCDPNKVGPDETTVKGGWQAEMFNGLAFRACDKSCMPDSNRQAILNCFKQHSTRAYNFYQQCTKNSTLQCTEQSKQEVHFCLATLSQSFVQQEKCGQILNEATIKCLAPQLTDQIELCFIKENVHRTGTTSTSLATTQAASNGSLNHLEVIVQSPKPAKAFLKQFEYANYDALRHACDPELEFDQQITSQEMTEIQAFYTIASTLCRDECLPSATKKSMRECLLNNSPHGAKVFNQCVGQFGNVCTATNEESLTSCFNTVAQNVTMNEKCVELVSDTTQKCWSSLIRNETTHCVERKNLQTVSFEYGKVCNSNDFKKRPKEEQNQITLAHKTNQENLLRRALEIMCFPNCVNNEQRIKMTKCMDKDSPMAYQIYNTCSKQSKVKCDMEENIESYAEYVNCIYTEADQLARASNRTNTCVNLVTPSSFKCLESLYPSEIFHCPDVKVFHEAQAEAISHHAETAQLDEYDYEQN